MARSWAFYLIPLFIQQILIICCTFWLYSASHCYIIHSPVFCLLLLSIRFIRSIHVMACIGTLLFDLSWYIPSHISSVIKDWMSIFFLFRSNWKSMIYCKQCSAASPLVKCKYMCASLYGLYFCVYICLYLCQCGIVLITISF